jgi:hypothetical protein
LAKALQDESGFSIEQTFGVLTFSWDRTNDCSPLEFLYLESSCGHATGNPSADLVFVRVKQSLLQSPSLAS